MAPIQVASRQPDHFLRLGLDEVTVDAFPLLLTDPDDAFGLPGWLRYFEERRFDGRFSRKAHAEWDEGIRVARAHGGLVYSLLYFVVSGRVS